MSRVWLIIIGMMMVTYIPRLVPFYMVGGKELPKKVKQFLEYVPYTALGALIIPGAIGAIPERPVVSVVGLSFACIYGWLRGGIIVSVVGSIGVVYLLLLVL